MKSIAFGLRSYLAGLSAVNAVSAVVALDVMAQKETPTFIVLNRIATEDFDDLSGTGDSFLAETFRLIVYGKTTETAMELGDSLRTTLRGFTGAMGTDRIAQAIYIEDRSGDYDAPEFVDGRYTDELTIVIQHSPAS